MGSKGDFFLSFFLVCCQTCYHCPLLPLTSGQTFSICSAQGLLLTLVLFSSCTWQRVNIPSPRFVLKLAIIKLHSKFLSKKLQWHRTSVSTASCLKGSGANQSAANLSPSPLVQIDPCLDLVSLWCISSHMTV